MRKKTNLIVLFTGFLIGALGYWALDISEEGSLFKSLLFIKAPAAFLATVIVGIFRKNQPSWNALVLFFGLMLGMVSRIFMDIFLDPTSHNLFPFELMIGLFILFPVCFIGSYLVHLVFYIAGKS